MINAWQWYLLPSCNIIYGLFFCKQTPFHRGFPLPCLIARGYSKGSYEKKTHQQFSTHETESLSFPIDGDHHVLVLQGLVNVLCFLILNITLKYISGWWFGTWLYFSIYWECHHPNWRTHIFQRGRSTTNQISVRDSMPFFCWVRWRNRTFTKHHLLPVLQQRWIQKKWANPWFLQAICGYSSSE